MNADSELLEEQYRKIVFVNWTEEAHKDCISGTSEEFWLAVYKKPNFKDLAQFVLTCLSVPVSNATVERIFSLVTAVKTKARNSMQLQTLDSIIRIRSELLLNGKCCKDFVPSQRMLNNYTSDRVYSRQQETAPEPSEDIELLL